MHDRQIHGWQMYGLQMDAWQMNRKRQIRRLADIAIILCVAFALLATIAAAQKHAARKAPPIATPNKLLSFKVSGTKRYSDKEVLGASGLTLGQDAADGDFKEAAERLGKSGLFSSVAYSFSYSDAGVKVEFQVTDNDKVKLLPARFENFVWFSDAELRTILERQVPLYKDSLLPDSGRLADRVTEALQALLSQHGLPGRVEYLRGASQEGGSLLEIVYRVEDLTIRIRNVAFPGASPDQSVLLERAAHQLLDAEYFRSKVAAVAKFDLLPVYLQRGYLKAEFAPAQTRVVSGPGAKTDSAGNSAASGSSQTQDTNKTEDTNQTVDTNKTADTNSGEVEVDVLVPVTPGKLYTVSAVTWKGNSAVTSDEASKLFHLAVGRPADAVRLETDTENLTRLYHSRGYMTAELHPEPHFDDAKSTVAYNITIQEGDLYRMGELEILGVDTPSKDRLRDAWTLREGSPYNADYAKKFLDDAARLLPRGLRYSVDINEELNKKEKVVDLTIRFKVQ